MSRRKRTQPLKSQIEVPWDPRSDLTSEETKAESPLQVPLEKIDLPQQQPRRYFDPQAQQQLIESIRQHGILQPLLVRPRAGDRYELVAGERRYRAAKAVELMSVPVTVRELDDQTAFQLALIENLQREDLNPVEETEGILQLLAFRLKLPIEEISPTLHRLQHQQKSANNYASNNVIGKSVSAQSENNEIGNSKDLQIVEEIFEGLGLMTWESFINNRLPLLNLPEEITEALRQGKIAYTKARVIAKVQNKRERTDLLEEAIAHNWSLSQIKAKIQSYAASRQSQKPKEATRTAHARSPSSRAVSSEIPERLKAAYQKVKKNKALSDPKKRQRIDKLLKELEALIDSE